MPTTQFPKILALVEGKMERLFVNNNFRYIEVIPIENGDSWTPDQMTDQVSSKYYTKNMDADAIIVWLDRERHQIKSENYRTMIIDGLISRGAPKDRIHVCIPDRMTENVILADELLMSEVFGELDYKYHSEGKNGKYLLSEMYRDAGIYYKETREGLRLLKKLRLDRAALRSPSAAALAQTLAFDCWWLKSQPG